MTSTETSKQSTSEDTDTQKIFPITEKEPIVMSKVEILRLIIEDLEEKLKIACTMINDYKHRCKQREFQLDKACDQINGLKWSLELEKRKS